MGSDIEHQRIHDEVRVIAEFGSVDGTSDVEHGMAREIMRLRDGTATVYYIVKRGVYDHGLIGMYRILDEAKARCEEYTTADPRSEGDGHHSYVIYETKIGTIGEGQEVAIWQGRRLWENRTRVQGEYTWQEVAR